VDGRAGSRLARATLALVFFGATGALLPVIPAAAAPAGQNCPQQATPDQMTPWAQQVLGADRAWPLSRGGQQRIALLDSGVDALQPVLAGHVEPGYDAVTGNGTANTDCLGTGTEVAGVMVAQAFGSTGLVGVAPDARVVPVRIIASAGFAAPTVDPAVLARGIDWAISQRVAVICVALPIYTDDPRVAAAIQHAEDSNVPVVAAVGDKGGGNDGNPKPYPASYPGVIGVGAVDVTGARWQGSGHGAFVSIAAPGAAVLTTQRSTGLTSANGTGIAAGFVAGTVALVRRRAAVTAPNITKQLMATATPAAGGPHSTDFGAGIVNPYGAVTELASNTSPAPLAAYAPHTLSPAEQARADAWSRSRIIATVLAATALLVVLLVLVAAAAIPRGQRRAWRPTLAAPVPHRAEPEEPAPPVMLFD
jgi:hypothetical protein